MLTMEHVAARILAAGLDYTAGTNLFIHRMPSNVTKGLVVLPALVGTEIPRDLRGFMRGSFQIITRDPSPLVSASQALAAANAVELDAGWVMLPATGSTPEARVHSLLARHLPIVFPRSDEGDVYEASVNFDFICQR